VYIKARPKTVNSSQKGKGAKEMRRSDQEKAKLWGIYCTAEKSALKNALEAVSECL